MGSRHIFCHARFSVLDPLNYNKSIRIESIFAQLNNDVAVIDRRTRFSLFRQELDSMAIQFVDDGEDEHMSTPVWWLSETGSTAAAVDSRPRWYVDYNWETHTWTSLSAICELSQRRQRAQLGALWSGFVCPGRSTLAKLNCLLLFGGLELYWVYLSGLARSAGWFRRGTLINVSHSVVLKR